jgi:ketosteroid isomerase-like protein
MKSYHRGFAFMGAAAIALLAGACQKQGAATADPDAVQKALKADETKWNGDFKAKNLEGLLGHYSDDAYLAAGGPAANGSTQIRKAYSDALSDNYFSVEFASDKMDVSGDLAYSRGHYTSKHQDPKTHNLVTDSGSYLTVYKKQADGSWKAVEDFTTADPTQTKSEPVKAAKPAKMITSGL